MQLKDNSVLNENYSTLKDSGYNINMDLRV